MSYLAPTRIHFSGYFQADVSTVNNDVRHFDNDKFQARYQKPSEDNQMNGWWNPEGSGAFRLLECRITGAVLDGDTLSPGKDPVFDMLITGSNDRVCGKLVDLDPQQQMVSQIWGLKVRLGDDARPNLLDSDYRVAPFINLWRRQKIGGGGSGRPLVPPVKIPDVGQPADAISYPLTVTSDERGKAGLCVCASTAAPGNPRDYIDGQLYGLGYALAQLPSGYVSNPWNFISLLVWNAVDIPDQPTWHRDIQPIMTQYGNLYPIMSRHLVDLGDYDSVVEHLAILDLAFSLPIEDPNYMPVTRDLSRAKQEMLLKWLRTPGADGKPLKGEEPASAALLRDQAETEDGECAGRHGGKTAFIHSVMNKSE